MAAPEPRQFLLDIVESCRLLREFTSGKTIENYRQDALLRAAVERRLEIAGEALNLLLRQDPTFAARITNWKGIIAFRNRLAHGYATIDNDVVWGVLEENLERLCTEALTLLKEVSPANGEING